MKAEYDWRDGRLKWQCSSNCHISIEFWFYLCARLNWLPVVIECTLTINLCDVVIHLKRQTVVSRESCCQCRLHCSNETETVNYSFNRTANFCRFTCIAYNFHLWVYFVFSLAGWANDITDQNKRCLCVCLLIGVAQILTLDVQTWNPACTDLLVNSNHKPKISLVYRSSGKGQGHRSQKMF